MAMPAEAVIVAEGAFKLTATLDPIGLGTKLYILNCQIKAALEAAKINKIVCEGICATLRSAVPWVLQIASIAHVYGESKPDLVRALNDSLTDCVQAAHEACLEVYAYLRHNRLQRKLKAAGMKEALAMRCQQFRDRLDDINRHIVLATFLRQADTEKHLKEVAQDVAAIRSLAARLQRMRDPARPEDCERVQDVARVELQRHKRHESEGQTLKGHSWAVWCVEWSPDGKMLATGSRFGRAALWDAYSGDRVRKLEGHNDHVLRVAWSPDGECVATASWDKTAALWRVKSGERVRVLQGHTDEVWDVAWSPDGSMVATASEDGTVALWDVQTGHRERVLRADGAKVGRVWWSPDGDMVVSGSVDAKVRWWRVETGAVVKVLNLEKMIHGRGAFWWSAVAWSADWESLALGFVYGTSSIFSASTNEKLVDLKGHSRQVYSIAWSPDDRFVATGFDNGTVALWDAKTGKRLRVLKGHSHWVVWVAWSPDGSTLATASRDNTVRLYRVEAEEPRSPQLTSGES